MNTTTTETRKDFETVKRNFETAFSSGRDYSTELLDLSTAVAYAVLNKCLDPQRKTAHWTAQRPLQTVQPVSRSTQTGTP